MAPRTSCVGMRSAARSWRSRWKASTTLGRSRDRRAFTRSGRAALEPSSSSSRTRGPRSPIPCRRRLRPAARSNRCGSSARTSKRCSPSSSGVTSLAKLVVRILSIIGKEIVEVFRRPGAVLSLILGPFLILAVFGVGYQGFKKDLAAIIVVDPSSNLPKDVASYQNLAVRGVSVVEVLPDRATAEAKLRADQVDIVIVPPVDPL